MGILVPSVKWPGVVSVETFAYTVNHGISPNTALLTTSPQTGSVPAAYGDINFTDGERSYTIRGCRVRRMDSVFSAAGTTWQLWIDDARWAWRNKYGGFGGVSGWYNQRDNRGELVPWSVRSPEELATICLRAMGVTQFRLRLPPGLSSVIGRNYQRRLFLGERFPPTNANPEVVWDHTPPAEALAALADLFGCRVIYRPLTGMVIVAPPGEGSPLPPSPVEMLTPSIDKAQVPRAIGVYGAPVRMQARFLLDPVGREWNGYPVAIDGLSYTPPGLPPRKQVTVINYTPETGINPDILQIIARWTPPGQGETSVSVEDTDHSVTDIGTRFGNLADSLAAVDAANSPPLPFTVSVTTVITPNITLTGRVPGQEFDIELVNPEGSSLSQYSTTVTQTAGGASGWEWCAPPPEGSFDGVLPTKELGYIQARALAQESVWKWYRISLFNPNRKGKKLKIPWYYDQYGTPVRRSQIVLQPTKVEQVTPQRRIPGGINPGNEAKDPNAPELNAGIFAESYTGRSRDQEATVRGSVYQHLGEVIWVPSRTMNTKVQDRVFVKFSVVNHESGEQLVVFSEPVYYRQAFSDDYAVYKKPYIVLETSCLMRHPENDQFLRYEVVYEIPGGEAPVEWHNHNDVAVGAIGEYDDFNNWTGWHYAIGDKEYADVAARYYLIGHAAKYVTIKGATAQYPYIVIIEPDAAIQQITWTFDGEGFQTIASVNDEHSPVILSYPDRRRAELLPPNKLAAEANLRERYFSYGIRDNIQQRQP